MKSKTSRRRLVPVFLIAGASVLGTLGFGGVAHAATVPNIFQRSCYFTCSPYVQSNGPFNSRVPTECITKGWSAENYLTGVGGHCTH
jgi:hypothetical protein